jgi:t-SNARE complex subunit (syntaxin)
MKTCAKCNLSFELSNFNVYKNRLSLTIDNYCKDCRRQNWREKRLKKQEKVKQLGFKSIHDYRIKTSKNYKEYYDKRSKSYNSEKDKPRKKKAIDDASDYYICELIRKDKSMKGVQIPNELIELYRANLLLKRQLNGKS